MYIQMHTASSGQPPATGGRAPAAVDAPVGTNEAALEYLAHHPADLLTLEMVMEPGMDGQKTHRQVVKSRTDQRAFIASGLSETGRVREAQQQGVGANIRDPYTPENIGLVVCTKPEEQLRAFKSPYRFQPG